MPDDVPPANPPGNLPPWLLPPPPRGTSVIDNITNEVHRVIDSDGDLILLQKEDGTEVAVGIDIFQKQFNIKATF